jgi:probable F420-dependent oxidoreductase
MQLGKIAAWLNLDPMTPQQAGATAHRLESLGYSALWYPESLTHDSLTRASTLLSATSSLIVASGIMNIYTRAPWLTGAAQRVLFDQSNGRFLLGLGVSHEGPVEESLHQTYGPPVATMRAYLSELDAEVAARDRSLVALGADDRPSLQARMPRVIAALGPKMLRLARDTCDGAHPYLVTPEHTRDARDAIGSDRWLCVEQKVIRQTDPTRARAIARSALALYLGLPNYLASWRRLGFEDGDFTGGGSDRLLDAVVAWGDDETIVRRLTEHLDAGASQVCVQAISSTGDGHASGPDWPTFEAVAAAFRDDSSSPSTTTSH